MLDLQKRDGPINTKKVWVVFLNGYPLECRTSIEAMQSYLVDETNWLNGSQFNQIKEGSLVSVPFFDRTDVFELYSYTKDEVKNGAI